MALANISWDELNTTLAAGEFQQLFVGKLGWDYPGTVQPFEIILQPSVKNADDSPLKLQFTPVVDKKSVTFLTCDVGGTMITKDQRRRAERDLTKHFHEHIVIYHTSNFSHQFWQIPRREPGKPVRLREMQYHHGRAANELHQFVQRLHFSLRDEANLTLVDVMDRIDTGVQAEKVTKQFYDEFSKQRKDFIKNISGIIDDNDRAWYAAIMLNRLMFSWFLQSKGLLDNDPNYLRTKLDAARSGKLPVPNFQSFYETFLKSLFHEALNQPTAQRDPALKKMLGNIPYINGGIFDHHRLETDYADIEIPDAAFEGIFTLFGQYTWHLDDRPIALPNEINPDVLGHIFEKFVNQKEKGAYYTKEDVTGYMSQNTIIPWLLDQAKKKVAIQFDHTKPGSVWELLKDSPQTYIYNSMKHGVIDTAGDLLPMPDALVAGENDYSQRENWNQRAEVPYALPTETWREYFHRRKRTVKLMDMLRSGDIHEVDDLITWNLDIRQFIQDIVAKDADVSLVKALWNGVREITILDPTVGSGAFLFAAVRVLEPIADELLNRMEALVEAEPSTHPGSNITEFKRILDDRDTHPNQRYYIMRQIILHNLYGVDIEEEAVEICKLRLFLLLVAHLDDPKNIEPLPDLDFNIRAGNTLVGYATRAEVDLAVKGGDASQMRLDLANNAAVIDERAEDAAKLFQKFKNIQSVAYADVDDLRVAKTQYEERISELRAELDGYLHQQQDPGRSFTDWHARTQPFHWFAEFHRVLVGNGGFDVIIGNPPYVGVIAARKMYELPELNLGSANDIYAYVMARAETLLSSTGLSTMIVPLSLSFSGKMKHLRVSLSQQYKSNWFSSYGRIPSALFSHDVRVRNTIHIGRKRGSRLGPYTTRLHRWNAEARDSLFESLDYADFSWGSFGGLVPKFNSGDFSESLKEMEARTGNTIKSVFLQPRRSEFQLYHPATAYNWVNMTLVKAPAFDSNDRLIDNAEWKSVSATSEGMQQAVSALTSGKLLFVFWSILDDDFHVTSKFLDFPLPNSTVPAEISEKLIRTAGQIARSLGDIERFKLNAGKKIGRYDMTVIRQITDTGDLTALQWFAWSLDVWEDIELLNTQLVKPE